MKKLSEIGTRVWPYLDSIESLPKCYMLDEPAAEGHQVEFLLSISERRELVAEAIKRWEAYKWHKLGGAKEIEEFLKEQGL